ncbi:histidine--tRNA ligase [Arenicellales bacterium nBUS_45]
MASGKAIQSIRGMNDLLPDQMSIWQQVETALRNVARLYDYSEIRTPILERTELFKRAIGEQTDIVEKEMYTFADNNGDSLTLRPEGTASTVRAGNQHGLLHNQTQRLWYSGPMFRHERPQKGRYRQFHQFGIEALGWRGPEVEAEVITVGERLWRMLGLTSLSLQINTLGSAEGRSMFRTSLKEYLAPFKKSLDEDSQRRLEKNPLRILDSKDANTQEILENAPTLQDFLESKEREHFETLQMLLSAAGVHFEVNPRLVRGLDYYTGFVFEWVTDQLGAQSAVCAGGRYDGLAEQLGGRSVPATGFACGLERLVELVGLNETNSLEDNPDVYLITQFADVEGTGVRIAEYLRNKDFKVVSGFSSSNLKKQLRRADVSGAAIAVIVPEDYLPGNQLMAKPLRGQGEQREMPERDLEKFLRECTDQLP